MKYGVCAHPWSLVERDFQEMKTLGAKYLRMDFSWQDFEYTRDAPFDYSRYDRFVNWSKTYDIEIIAVLMRVPSWFGTGGDVNIPVYGAVFDDFVNKFGQFTRKVVEHYKDSITYFEVWNEPNYYGFWRDPDATYENGEFVRGMGIQKYVRLLQEAFAQAKIANSGCKIIGGAIGNDKEYLEGMYANGAKAYFDIFGSHPYFGNSPTKNYDVDYIDPLGHIWHFPKIQYMRDVMVANGDSSKPILITELGVDSESGPEGVTTLEMQADRLTRVYQKTQQEYPWVEGIMWYELRDDHIGNYGLMAADFTYRPMYYAYQSLATKRWFFNHWQDGDTTPTKTIIV